MCQVLNQYGDMEAAQADTSLPSRANLQLAHISAPQDVLGFVLQFSEFGPCGSSGSFCKF